MTVWKVAQNYDKKPCDFTTDETYSLCGVGTDALKIPPKTVKIGPVK